MPIDLEMILSASPPIFSTGAFMDFRYGPFNHHNNNSLNDAIADYHVRSCLLDKTEQENHQRKKRVWFADDKGLALTHVKIMSEPSNCPPRWTDEFLAHVTRGIKQITLEDVQWLPQFAQPASDYLEFRSKLQKNCVSLENVIVKEGERNITGTIKVKNLAFDKEVFVRVTYDKWSTSEDVEATFVSNGLEAGSSMYDTFSFVVSVPQTGPKFESIEFCVCFRCSGQEYWDNNGGSNYKLSVVDKKETTKVPQGNFGKQCNDALQVSMDSWSEFASWSHLITEGPYW